MSTRSCIYIVDGTDPSEGSWVFDLHEDLHDPSHGLDVYAAHPQRNQQAEFTFSVEDVRKLRDSLSGYLERNLL